MGRTTSDERNYLEQFKQRPSGRIWLGATRLAEFRGSNVTSILSGDIPWRKRRILQSKKDEIRDDLRREGILLRFYNKFIYQVNQNDSITDDQVQEIWDVWAITISESESTRMELVFQIGLNILHYRREWETIVQYRDDGTKVRIYNDEDELIADIKSILTQEVEMRKYTEYTKSRSTQLWQLRKHLLPIDDPKFHEYLGNVTDSEDAVLPYLESRRKLILRIWQYLSFYNEVIFLMRQDSDKVGLIDNTRLKKIYEDLLLDIHSELWVLYIILINQYDKGTPFWSRTISLSSNDDEVSDSLFIGDSLVADLVALIEIYLIDIRQFRWILKKWIVQTLNYWWSNMSAIEQLAETILERYPNILQTDISKDDGKKKIVASLFEIMGHFDDKNFTGIKTQATSELSTSQESDYQATRPMPFAA